MFFSCGKTLLPVALALSSIASAQSIVSAPSIASTPALHGAVVVRLASSTADAAIRYTVDGSTPDASAQLYTAPFLVAANLTVKAIATAPGSASSSVASQSFTPNIPSGTLVWSDDFRAAVGAQPNPQVWGYDTGQDGWGNHELEDYCAWASSASPCNPASPNTYVGQDGLHIVARQPKAGVYTSARLKTQGLFSFQYGRLEVRAHTPEAQGLWPAIWLLGNNIPTVGWPACGELDMVERVGAADVPDWNEGSVHGSGFTGTDLGTKYYFPQGQTAAGWHTYGMIWTKGSVAYYIDDPAHPYVTYTPANISGFKGAVWPFDTGSYFLILNLAVGGSWPGNPTAATPFPSELVVDYVRIYAN